MKFNLFTKSAPKQEARGAFDLFSEPKKRAVYTTKTQQLQAYEKNEWVFAGCRKLARAVAKCELKCYEVKISGGKKELTEVFDIEPLVKITKNRKMSLREFLYVGTLGKSLTGEAIFRIDQIDMTLIYLKQDEVEVKGDDEIKEYVYKGRPIPIEQILHLREPSPDAYAQAVSPLKAAGETIASDNSAKEYSGMFFENNATPNVIISFMKALTPQAFKKWVRSFYAKNRGAGNAHKTHITDTEIKVHQLSPSQKDMQLVEQGNASMKRILAVIGVPKEKVGDVSDANRANMDAVEAEFQTDVVLPELLIIEDALNIQYLPAFEEPREYVFKFEDPTPEDKEFKLKKRDSDSKNGAITINEMREEDGREGVKGGDQTLVEASKVPVEQAVQNTITQATEGKKKRLAPQTRKISFTDAEKKEICTRYLKRFDQNENKVRKTAVRLFDNQETQVNKNLKKEAGNRSDIDVESILFDIEVENEISSDAMERTLTSIYAQEGAEALSEAGVDEAFIADDPAVRKAIEEQAQAFAEEVNKTTYNKLKKNLNAGIKEGESYSELSARVKKVFTEATDSRADNIAITETNTASNSARFESYGQAGFEGKEWGTNVDGRERDAHRRANGQVVSIKKKFTVGGEKMNHPSDRSSGASAGNVCRCRCHLLPR